MFSVLLFTLLILLIAYNFVRRRLEQNDQYFQAQNVPYKGFSFSLKTFSSVVLGKINVFEFTQRNYNGVPTEPLYGVTGLGLNREYFFRDPEAIKHIAIKDFDHFEDRRGFFNEEVEDLWGKSLFSLHGEKWRQMRATLSPAFTGSKMRQMFELIVECSDGIVKHFMKKAETGEKLNVEMKDVFSRYTNDVIATCAFGIKINSFADCDNSFYLNGKKLMDFGSAKRGIRFIIGFVLPRIARIFDIRFFDKTISNIFKSIILDTMDVRQKNNIFRPDMINILMQVRAGTFHEQIDSKPKESADGFATVEESDVGRAQLNRKWSENEIVAQCLLFFLAGFETSSSVLMFTAYELVANPDIQQKLYKEIADTNEQLNGNRITYDVLQKMKYFDQVICETLRKWPVAVQVDRVCVKDYNYDDGKLKFKIEKGSCINISLYGIQRDPKYFPNPDVFDPERFSDENKHNIVPNTYVPLAPFGVGPRNCIGSRFALMELKAIIYYLLLNFSFEPNRNTQIPLKMKRSPFVIVENGVNLELKPRRR